MRKVEYHYALGLFIDEQRMRASLAIETMCKEVHIGTGIYYEIKGELING